MTSTLKKRLALSAVLPLAGLVACGGGGGSSSPAPAPTATSLAYTDPASGTYLLKKDAASSGSHLILDLVGPASGTASGVTLTLNADTTKVTWVDVPAGVSNSVLVQNGTQFDLGMGPAILLARASGTTLQATVAQKGLAVTPASLNGVLLKVALDLKPNLGLAQGTTISLTPDGAKCLVLDGTKGSTAIAPITVSVGTLAAQ